MTHFLQKPVSLKIYTLTGQLVFQMPFPGAGQDTDKTYEVDLSFLSSGIYCCRIETAETGIIKRLSVIK
jgi:Secretion system C-terminal sorting domain